MADIEISGGELALSGEEGRAPSEFRILRAGETATRKGRVLFDSDAAAAVMAEYAADPRPLAIDYEHAHLPTSGAPPSEKRAAGWFRPEVRGGELWAADVDWTPRGREAVEAKEFRFTSLWGDGERDGERVRLRRLRNVALTNTPAVIGSVPLVQSEGPEDKHMSEAKSALVIALGCSEEAEAVAKVQGLSLVMTEVEAVTGKSGASEAIGALRALKLKADGHDALALELSELKARADSEKREALIVKLSEEGKLPPALHDWARALDLKALIAFGEGAPKLVSDEQAPKPPKTDTIALSEELKAMLKRTGQTEDDYRAAVAAGHI